MSYEAYPSLGSSELLDSASTFVKDQSMDPAEDNNFAIRRAAQNGHVDVVRLLLADARVDPAAHDNEAIQASLKLYDAYKAIKDNDDARDLCQTMLKNYPNDL